MANHCNKKTEVFSRVVGFYRPVQQWNNGKKEEFKDREEFDLLPEKDKNGLPKKQLKEKGVQDE